MMDETELKPCPFCGKPFEIFEYPDDGTAHWLHNNVDCPMHRDTSTGWLYCNVTGMAEELNRRPIEDTLRAEVARLTAELAAREWVPALDAWVSQYRQQYAAHWRELPETFWLARLVEEVGELAASTVNDHEHTPDVELAQIAGICINWLEMRGNYPPAPKEARNE